MNFNKNKIVLVLSILVVFTQCKKDKIFKEIKVSKKILTLQKKSLSEKELKNWHLKDIEIDSVPGISLKRAFDSLPLDNRGEEVIVAIIDTEIDIDHKDLTNKIWVNTKEIANNNIDDDNNGYVDDIYGWNFIGNLSNNNILYSSLESIRVIQKYQKSFQDSSLSENDKKYYLKAKKYYDAKLKKGLEDQEYGNFLFEGHPKAKKALKKLFPEENYTSHQLDSVYKKFKTKNNVLAKHAYFLSDFIKYKLSEKWIKDYKKRADTKLVTTLNLEYVDREEIDKESDNIDHISYGNPYVNKNTLDFYHGTLVAGTVILNDYTINSKNNFSNTKIMSLAISSNGEEHDKDIALAIRYAVDNGAKVINMSFGKEFSLYKEWVFDALKYAENNDVLIVSSAGNSKTNLTFNNNYYPNDNVENGNEVSDNFLLVGSISNKLDKSLLSYYSNYGNEDVDVFAPGQSIYTILPNNKYKFDSGTSLASAITSGVAALLFSYYPTLTASEVKHILMDSGLEYTIPVATPTKEDKDKTTPFNQLSKSGKVINAYNALIMADSIARK